MIKTYEGFFDNIFNKSAWSSKESLMKDIRNFFYNVSALDVKYALCDITDNMTISDKLFGEDFIFLLHLEMAEHKLLIENDRFRVEKRVMRFCGYENLEDFIESIFFGKHKNKLMYPKFYFNIEFSKDYTAKGGTFTETNGKLNEEEMEVINNVGERIKDICGFKTYEFINRGGPFETPIWRMRFSF